MICKTLKMLLAAGLAAAALVAPAAASPFPGPDAFGYSGADIGLNFRDISTTGTRAFGGPTDDSVTGAVGIGFNFSFYGSSYSDAYIGSNGFITFSPNQSQGCCSGGTLPGYPYTTNMVAGWFTDLVSGFNNVGSISYETQGTAGSREFIVQYDQNPYCCISSNTNTFEIILHEGTNDIELQYLQTTADGHSRSVGIQNADATIGLQKFFDNSTLLNQQGLCISTTSSSTCTAATDVPEPTGLALTGLGLLLLGASRRRKAGAKRA